jgi:hypothetical protein
MCPVKNETHSFIIKIWLEEMADANKPFAWRGHVMHVPDGKRQYVQNLNDIIGFIEPYLEDIGADINQGRQRRFWLMPWSRRK